MICCGVIGVGIVFAEAYVVGGDHGEVAVGVNVPFVGAVGRVQPLELQELRNRSGIGGLNRSCRSSYCGCVIRCGGAVQGSRLALVVTVEAEIVSLHFVVSGTIGGRKLHRAEHRQHAARRITGTT